MKTFKGTLFGVFALIAIEQIIKIIIYSSFFYNRFAILPPLLYFEPMFNTRYSWFNSMLKFDGSKYLHITVVIIMSILIYLFYRFLCKKFGKIKIINIMFAFLFSGATCSLIDKVFWDGSLDYILVKGFFTFDLKDVYINVFIGLMVFSLLFKSKASKVIYSKNTFKDFSKFILRR